MEPHVVFREVTALCTNKEHYQLAGGIPKLGDLGVEGHPASAQVNARVLQQGFLTLGLYDRKV